LEHILIIIHIVFDTSRNYYIMMIITMINYLYQ
jgi:hypothetical protein